MVEELLQSFIGVIDANLFESVELNSFTLFYHPKKKLIYIEYFKASNIQDTDEKLSFDFRVQGLVDTGDQPCEHSVVQRFCQRSKRIYNLTKYKK